jgi:hypothetical protein
LTRHANPGSLTISTERVSPLFSQTNAMPWPNEGALIAKQQNASWQSKRHLTVARLDVAPVSPGIRTRCCFL